MVEEKADEGSLRRGKQPREIGVFWRGREVPLHRRPASGFEEPDGGGKGESEGPPAPRERRIRRARKRALAGKLAR